jgi:hypothetical protein
MLSENLIGQTRRFSSDEAHWECTVVALKNSHTALLANWQITALQSKRR